MAANIAVMETGGLLSLVEDYVSDQREEEIPLIIVKYISNKSIDLLNLVEALGVHLTSSDIGRRIRGTKLLSSVLSQFYNYQLSRDEVVYLVSFYIDRLKDSPMVTPHVLQGILALANLQRLSDEEVVNIVRGLFSEIHNQALMQSNRNTFYSILFLFLRDYSNALSQISPEFILGYIQSMDGEKDPRNLLIVFNSVPFITTKLKLDVLVEDLFEVLSCYFPINFNPPPDESNPVSKDDLVSGLRKCLVSTSKFAEYCIPLLLDKLSSDLTAAKIDSLLTLIDGLSVFEVSSFLPYTNTLWNNLKREIFQPSTEDTEALALRAVTQMCKSLTLPVSFSNHSSSSLYSFIKIINNDISHFLSEPDLRLMKPAGSVVIAIADGSGQASQFVADIFLPIFIQQLLSQSQESKRNIVLEIIINLMKSFKPFSSEEGSPISENYEKLLFFLLSSPKDNSSLIINAISALIDLNCLPVNEVKSCVTHLMELVYQPSLNEMLHKDCVDALGLTSKAYPLVIKETILPSLITSLKDSNPVISIMIIQSVSTNSDIISVTLPALTASLTEAYNNSEETSTAVMISKAIADIIESKHGNELFIHEHIIPQILKMCIDSGHSSLSDTELILVNIGSIFYYHNLSLDEIISTEWTEELIRIFMSSDNSSFKPLSASSSCQQTINNVLLTSVIGSAYSRSLCSKGRELLYSLVHLSLASTHLFTVCYTVRSMCYLINKMEEEGEVGEGFSDFINKILCDLWSVMSDDNKDTDDRYRALESWKWITKGLVMRSHTLGADSVLKIMSLYTDPLMGRRAAQSFEMILRDEREHLSHGNITLFYRQYIFTVCVPVMLQLFTGSAQLVKECVLVSLSHLMQSVPKSVLIPELPKLFPLLLESLRVNHKKNNEGKEETERKTSDMNVTLSSLEATHSLIEEAPDVMGQHLPSLLSVLLQLSQESPYMKVRMSSLKCLGLLPSTVSVHLVYPHQSNVIDQLGYCLDDRKRLVRKEAVISRSEWYLLGHKES